MANYSTTLVDNVLFGMALGNISHTITTQHNEAGMFYAYSNIGNSTSSVGAGLNIKKWYGLNVYLSSNIGIGSSVQFTPYITYGTEISVFDGVSFSFGTISENVTNETTVSVGWGTLAFAYATCAGCVCKGQCSPPNTNSSFICHIFRNSSKRKRNPIKNADFCSICNIRCKLNTRSYSNI